MREFGSARLHRMDLQAKLAYTLFLLLLLGGICFTLFWSFQKHSLTPTEVARHYRGNPREMVFEKPIGELLETTHSHVFTLPVIFLIVAHLFFLTTLKKSLKIGFVLLLFLTLLSELVTPYLVLYRGAPFAYILFLGRLLFFFCLLFMSTVSLKEMWF